MVKPLDSLSVVFMCDGYGSAFDVKGSKNVHN